MAAHLNGIPNGEIVVIWTFDEPQGNRTAGNLPAAMYRCGASRAVFGSSQFRFRSAYILVGVAGSGEGMGAEVYSGAVDADPNAWCELGFQIQNGVLTVSGANGGARSLYDFSPAVTENIAPNAVTDVGGVVFPSSSSPGIPGGASVVLAFFVGPTITLTNEDVLNFDISGFHLQNTIYVDPFGDTQIGYYTTDAVLMMSRVGETLAESGDRSYSSTLSFGMNVATRLTLRHTSQIQPGAGNWQFQLWYRTRGYSGIGAQQGVLGPWENKGVWNWTKTKR